MTAITRVRIPAGSTIRCHELSLCHHACTGPVVLTGPVRGSSSPEAEFCWDTLSPFMLRAFTYRLGPTGTWAGRTVETALRWL
ncbi:hypothetical protein SCMC78_71180 [Streptomyces sp. CMC78]|uniref:Uncharacterized protein n=1 Tax=Streptomyces sp. CMC78 TaxID=3231512 RepID=A0AB33KT88_9ACTN